MKSIIVFFSTVFITVLLFSCQNKSAEKTLPQITGEIATIECRAFALRNERFELANKMRFKQDSLSGIKQHKDSVAIQQELAKMDLLKDSILTASLQLADSIKLKMDYLMSQYLTDKEKQQAFNTALDALLTKNGCK